MFQQADRFAASGLTLLVRANGACSARLGLAIAKKQVRAASARNRIRRLTREAFRLRRAQLPSVDLIVMCRAGVDKLSNGEIEQALQKCFDRLCARPLPPTSALPAL